MSDDPLAPLAELPGVFEAADAARAAIDGLLREPALRRSRGQVRAESRRRGAWASAQLAGATIELDDFDAPFAEDDQGRLCAAALRVNTELGSLADTWRRAPLQALARLHVLAAAGSVPDDLLGRPKTDPAVAARLAGLAEVATSSEVSGVVVAAVIQGDLLDLEPFGFADSLIARAASRLVLVSRGVDPDALTVPDEGMLRLGSDRLTAGIADYRSGEPQAMASWLIYVAATVQQGALIARSLC